MPFQTYFILFISVVISGSSFFLFRRFNARYLKLSLAFSGAYLFAVTVLDLLPEVYSSTNNFAGVYILIGFMLQILLELLSEGIEHGHVHIHRNNISPFPFFIMLGLCIHSLLEGMPLSEQFNDQTTNNSLLMGIVLHHIPVSFALMSMLVGSKVKTHTSLICLFTFAIMAPLGIVLSNFLSNNILLNISSYFDRIMAVVIGIFLHISTTILFESDEKHRFNIFKAIVILTGVGLALILA